jgi:hypothetical protein
MPATGALHLENHLASLHLVDQVGEPPVAAATSHLKLRHYRHGPRVLALVEGGRPRLQVSQDDTVYS